MIDVGVTVPGDVMNDLVRPLRLAPLEGTKDSLPALSATRYRVMATLRALYDQWGYASVEVPAIEAFDPRPSCCPQSL